MQVNEIFYSIQGEGKSLGKPSIFLRLAGCNLKCVWCDTKYTWLYSEKTILKMSQELPKFALDQLGSKVYSKEEEIHIMEIDDIIYDLSKYPSKHVIITGGEPLLQKTEIEELIIALLDYTFEIETNGTIDPFTSDEINNKIHYNVSPKLSNSFNPLDKRQKIDVLKRLNKVKSSFKFVITKEEDIQEVIKLKELININSDKMFLMPEGTTSKQLKLKAKWLVDLCLKMNYNYTHRLHIELYDDKRGV